MEELRKDIEEEKKSHHYRSNELEIREKKKGYLVENSKTDGRLFKSTINTKEKDNRVKMIQQTIKNMEDK